MWRLRERSAYGKKPFSQKYNKYEHIVFLITIYGHISDRSVIDALETHSFCGGNTIKQYPIAVNIIVTLEDHMSCLY